MSRMLRESALSRIKCTPPDDSSVLAVFECPDQPEFLDVVFFNTLATHARIDAGDPRFLGVYDKTSDLRVLRCGNTFAQVYT